MIKRIDIGQVEGAEHYALGWNRKQLFFGKAGDKVDCLIRFRPHYLKRGLPERLRLHFIQPKLDIDGQQLRRLNTLAGYLETIDTSNPTLVSSYLNVLVDEACTLYRTQKGMLHVHAHEKLLIKLLDLIEQNFKTQLRTLFYAEQLGIVDRKLNEICEYGTGFLVMEIIEKRRMVEAEALLSMSKMLVKSIAAELGFVCSSHFTFWFLQRQGMRPKAYRELTLKDTTHK